MVYPPSASVTARAPPGMTVTLAPWSTAPDESVAWPWIVPRAVWARAVPVDTICAHTSIAIALRPIVDITTSVFLKGAQASRPGALAKRVDVFVTTIRSLTERRRGPSIDVGANRP